MKTTKPRKKLHIKSYSVFSLCNRVVINKNNFAVLGITNSGDICRVCLLKFDKGDFQ